MKLFSFIEDPTSVNILVVAFCVVTPFSLVAGYWHLQRIVSFIYIVNLSAFPLVKPQLNSKVIHW
jgi:hypothetical protein